MKGFLAASYVLAALGLCVARASAAPALEVDHAVVRFWSPDAGGVGRPHFVYARVLAFEARIEALSDRARAGGEPYRARHVSDALERHIAETLLASLNIDPEPDEATLLRQVAAGRARLLERAGGELALEALGAAEGIGPRDIFEILRRQARASLYLDRMIAPMLDPSRAELVTLHRTRHNPFRDLPFDKIEPGLRRWYVSQKLAAAVQNFYQNAQGRVTLTLLAELPGGAEVER
jgi:hypothetical protein